MRGPRAASPRSHHSSTAPSNRPMMLSACRARHSSTNTDVHSTGGRSIRRRGTSCRPATSPSVPTTTRQPRPPDRVVATRLGHAAARRGAAGSLHSGGLQRKSVLYYVAVRTALQPQPLTILPLEDRSGSRVIHAVVIFILPRYVSVVRRKVLRRLQEAQLLIGRPTSWMNVEQHLGALR